MPFKDEVHRVQICYHSKHLGFVWEKASFMFMIQRYNQLLSSLAAVIPSNEYISILLKTSNDPCGGVYGTK